MTAAVDWKADIRRKLDQRGDRHKLVTPLMQSCAKLSIDNLILRKQRDEFKSNCAVLEEEKSNLAIKLTAIKESGGGGGGDGVVSSKAREDILKLERKVTEMNEELVMLHRERSSKSQEQVETLQALKRSEAEMTRLKTELEDSKVVIRKLHEGMESLAKSLDTKSIEFQSFLDEHLALQLEYNRAELDVKRLTNENQELVDRWLKKKEQDAQLVNAMNDDVTRLKQMKAAQEMLDEAMKKQAGSELTTGATERTEVPRQGNKTEAHAGEVYDVCCSNISGRFGTAGSDKKVKIWNPYGACEYTLTGHSSGVSCLDIGFTDDYIVSGGADKAMYVWSLQSGRSLHKLTGHVERIHSCKFSLDGGKIFSSSQDRTIKVWDVKRGDFEASFLCFSTALCLLASSSDKNSFTSSHFDKSIKVWDTRGTSKKPVVEMVTGHVAPVTHICPGISTEQVLTASKDNMLKLIDIRAQAVLHTFSSENFRVGPLSCKPTVSPDGNYIASGTDTGQVFIWNIATGQVQQALTHAHSDAVTACAWNNTTGQLITVSKDKCFITWQ